MEVRDIVQETIPKKKKCIKAKWLSEKAFLNDQCEEIEENNRMGKSRNLFKKIRDTKGTFHAKMDLIKDRNDIDLIEAKYIKKK